MERYRALKSILRWLNPISKKEKVKIQAKIQSEVMEDVVILSMRERTGRGVNSTVSSSNSEISAWLDFPHREKTELLLMPCQDQYDSNLCV